MWANMHIDLTFPACSVMLKAFTTVKGKNLTNSQL